MPRQALMLTLILMPLGATAQMTHDHTAGMTHDSGIAAAAVPTEPGQGAFAAVAEIAALLSADPDTDWSQVNLTALRDHLIDMDRLMTSTQVQSEPVPQGLRLTVTGDAALRMVPAHAPILAAETGWTSVVETRGDSVVWTVTGDADRIRGLGFYGLMATGDHHAAHHMAIATGQPMGH